MNIFMRGDQAVPIIIAKRLVKRDPKISKTRKFVGIKQGLGTLVDKTIDVILECFWDVEQNIEDAGEFDMVHYAIDISDDPGAGAPELVVTKLVGKGRPGCGIYCEVISPVLESVEEQPHTPTQEESVARMVMPKRRRPGPLPPPMRGQHEG